MIKKYLVKWKKNGIYHNAVWEGKNKNYTKEEKETADKFDNFWGTK